VIPGLNLGSSRAMKIPGPENLQKFFGILVFKCRISGSEDAARTSKFPFIKKPPQNFCPLQ